MKTLFRRLMEPVLVWQIKRMMRRHQPVVVAVAGSVGKTTTRLAIASVLGQKFGDRLHPGRHNYNTEIGLPLAIFNQDVPSPIINPLAWIKVLQTNERLIKNYPYDCLVLELGTDKPGDLAYFTRWLKPKFGVVTAVAPEHMEFFSDLDAVAEEEFTLARAADKAVLNDRFIPLRQLAEKYAVAAEWYSEVNLHALWRQSQGAMRSKAWPRHIQQALGAAIVVGQQLELDDEQLLAGVEAFEGAPGRMRRLAGVNNSQIIDDTYNSSPEAVKAALDTLKEAPGKRKIVVLGQMNELGEQSDRYHAEAGRLADWVDLLITIGDKANAYLGPASELEVNKRRFAFSSPYEAGEYLKKVLQSDDVVLVKGSQNGVFAEECVKQILADPADAAKLVRQSAEWQARKAQAFGLE
jgi:UDP-N-acetylmuramoyl-tripeptide--D-alanyl-D-alanine ligase